MLFSIIIRRINKDTEKTQTHTHGLLVAGLYDNPVCVFSHSERQEVTEIHVEMKTRDGARWR